MKSINKPVRVILADDHTLVRAGIRALLEKLPEVEVLGEANDGREVLNLVKIHRPDVVLMDISMPGLNGLDAAARMTREFADVRIIILSMHNNEEYYWRARGGLRNWTPCCGKRSVPGSPLEWVSTIGITGPFRKRGGFFSRERWAK